MRCERLTGYLTTYCLVQTLLIKLSEPTNLTFVSTRIDKQPESRDYVAEYLSYLVSVIQSMRPPRSMCLHDGQVKSLHIINRLCTIPVQSIWKLSVELRESRTVTRIYFDNVRAPSYGSLLENPISTLPVEITTRSIIPSVVIGI